MSNHEETDFDTLPELSRSQQARLDSFIDDCELAFEEDSSFTIDQLNIDDQELIPHLRCAINHLRKIDRRLQNSTLIAVPQEIEGFRYRTVMGSGATGVVFRCSQRNGNRDVAVKVMKPEIEFVDQEESFQREVTTAASVAGTGVVAIHQTGTTVWSGKKCFWFSMELLEGGTISSYARRECLSVSQRLQLLRSVCLTLDRLHQVGILHRDLKPSNILTSEDGRPYIVDFGIAKFAFSNASIHDTETGAPSQLGTIAWSAPELLRYGSRVPADVRSEIFSVGLILFDLLAGKHPFAAPSKSAFDVSQQIINEPAPLLSSVLPQASPDLECFVGRLLEADPTDRYASYAEVISEIDCLLSGLPVRARRLSLRERSNRLVRRHRTVILGATLAIAALVFTTLRFYFLSENLAAQQKLLQASNSKLGAQQVVLANRSSQLQDSIRSRDRSLRNSKLLTLSLLVASDPETTRSVLEDENIFPKAHRLLVWQSLWNDAGRNVEILPQVNAPVRKMLLADAINRLLIVSKNYETLLVNLQSKAVQHLKIECYRNSLLIQRPAQDTCLCVNHHSMLSEIDLIDGEIVTVYPITKGMDGHFAVTSNGSLVAGVNHEGSLFVVDLASAEIQKVISKPLQPVTCLWFSDADRLLCALTRDGKIQKWDWQNAGRNDAQIIDLILQGLPKQGVSSASYVGKMNGGEALVIRAKTGAIYQWRPTTYPDHPLRRIPLGSHGEVPRRLTLARPNRLFTLEKSVIEYALSEPYTPRLLPIFKDHAAAFAVSKTGQRMAISHDSGEIAIASVPSTNPIAPEFAPLTPSNDWTTGDPTVLAYLPSKGNVAIGYSGGWVRIETGDSTGQFVDWRVGSGPVTDIQWHPNGQSLAVSIGGATPAICVGNIGDSVKADVVEDPSNHVLIQTQKSVRKVRFSNCGDYLFSAMRDGRVLKLDAKSLKTLAEWEFHTSGCFGLDVIQDYVATGDSNGVICLRNWRSGQVIRSWQAHDRRIADVGFSPNSNLIFSCGHDSMLRSWTLDGELVNTFSGHNQEVTDFAFADNGQTLMSGGRDRSIKFWDAGTGELQRSIVAQISEIKDVLYHEKRALLLSASADGTIRVIVD